MSATEIASLTDQEIVSWALDGAEPAYRELMRRYERPVYALIYRMVRDRELAEDLTQETFVKVLNALERYRPEYKFSSWIFKIANNAAIDQLRRKELDTLSLEGGPDATTPDRVEATSLQVGSDGESPLEELEARELGSVIERAISQLRPEYQSCIIMRHVEGRPYEEIADILDLPLGTVKTYIHRARAELRTLLEPIRE
jgi:RNA polymerase sigma-70 factor (ECF subfamily)